MTTTADRDALAARVRKLQKMTQANDCSEAEAAFAAERIAAIMAEHQLTQDELSLKEDAAHCVMDDFLLFGQSVGDWYIIQQSIARLYVCKAWQRSVRLEEIPELGFSHPVRPFRFYGLPYDVVACISTMSICYTAVATECEKQKRKAHDFGFGMITRLAQRIDELKPKFKTGTGLMVLKDQLVTDAFAKEGIRLRTTHAKARDVDQAAFAKGFAAGDHVNIHGGRDAAPAPSQRLLRGH
jgi:hypothetical protein